MLKLGSKSPKFKIMPIASKNFAEFELKRTNQTLGTNLVLGKNGNGYTLYTDETRTSEINCSMTFNQVTTALATMRRMFEYKNLKDQVFKKMRKDQEEFYYSKISKLGTN